MLISVIVPVHNASSYLPRCLESIVESEYPSFECIVVDDSSTDESRSIAESWGVTVLSVPTGPRGPAFARNLGAQAAAGEILFFVDADVVIRPDTLQHLANHFQKDPSVSAVFGSYDEDPGSHDFVSQYKNLFHHFVHQQGREEAATFWSGCGAVRHTVFTRMGGFDAVRYPKPSIEDIELGGRLRAAGHRILLDRNLQAKHLKLWTLGGLVKVEVLSRAVPWTRLILERRDLPNDLNLGLSQRFSSVLVWLLLAMVIVLVPFFPIVATLPLLGALSLLLISFGNWIDPTAPVIQHLPVDRFSLIAFNVAALIALAVVLDTVTFLIPIAIVLGLHMIAIIRQTRLQGWGSLLFGMTLGGLATSVVLVLLELPLWTVGILSSGLGLIVLLNSQFYSFFSRTRGGLFASAVIPFHLLYYLYSVVGLVIGVLTAYVARRQRAMTQQPGRAVSS